MARTMSVDLSHDNDGGGAQARTHVAQAVEVHEHGIADRLGQHRHRRTPGDDRQQIVPAAAHAAGMPLDQFFQRNAHFLFDIARPLHMAGDAEDLGAAVLGPAETGEPGGATAQDGGRNGDGFDIVDSGRTAIETDAGRKGRLQARLALLAFERLDQRGFLAADIGAGAPVDIKIEVPAGAAGVLADQPAA